ncbi:phosphatidate cytidylyltransferase [Marinibactrum halimedae]|uniref:Phosphatidate cytidylyltransferase n=1 Tax=Marinibactrum halimedae TaxID=1444977 RepID=A0AA37WQE8_9GAMM|nr:phosphatidate cytidylyltransferase [Marinibactrum halimedae]MCD9457576.1 phosphatidate cytidylyltransferase [Marinibactrum halimedae]GLS27996.1 phosphatidate cytidylyltransferase [Marinibactrum halimedae]
MLKARVLSAIVMALVFLSALFLLPAVGFFVFISIVVLMAAWEWANLAGFQRALEKLAFTVLLSVAGLCIGWYVGLDTLTYLSEESIRDVVLTGCVWWCIALLWVQGYPSSAVFWGARASRLAMGFFVLLPAWLGLIFVRSLEQGAWMILLLIAIVACADIGAYFTGKAFGRRKLASAVSPGKSWEGVWGGFTASMLLALLIGQMWFPDQQLALFAVVIPTALVSILGDLLESMVKRHRGIKDSGQLLPGHGGVLDRVDGITASAPVFTLALLSTGLV